MSLALVNSGLSSFQKIEQANARDIEMVVYPSFNVSASLCHYNNPVVDNC